jgi:Uncharacterized protein involved in methicillin resistance
MKALRKIDAGIMDEFVATSPYNHYKKTSNWATHETNKNNSFHYLGYFEDEILKGTALLIQTKLLFGSYIYIPLGPCVDYLDIELTKEFLNEIIHYAKKCHASFIRIDPNVIRVSRDILGNQTPEIDYEFVTAYLKELGFRHKGYGYAYNGSWSNRYTLVIDISKDIAEIISGFNKSKQNVLKRQEKIGVITRNGNEEDIATLMALEEELSVTQKFKPHSKEYFLQYLQNFKDYAHLYVTELNTDTLISAIEEEIQSGKYKKDKEALLSKEKELLEAKLWKKQYGTTIPMAAGLFLHYGYKSWDLYTYSRKEFNNLKPTDHLHLYAITDQKSRGVTFYDMCGFSGVVNKQDHYYGLYDYKKSFGSQFIEYIGEFDYPLQTLKYNLYLYTYKVKLRLQYYWRRITS